MKNLARLFGLGNDKLPVDKQESAPENQAVVTLLPPIEPNTAEVKNLDIQAIIPNPFQPRKLFNDESLQELSLSIKE